MRKYHTDLTETLPQAKKRSRVPSAVLFGLVLLVSPVVYEAGQVVVARWLSMTGAYRIPETPILDWLTDSARTADENVKRSTNRFFHSGPLSPSSAVPLGIIWAILMAVVFLRRVR